MLARKPALMLVLVLALTTACRSKPSAGSGGTNAAPGTSASAEPAPESPAVPPEEVQRAVNPGNEKPYSGPIGTVNGTVRVSGDPAPELTSVLAKIPPGRCDDARAFYGKLFREGPNRELGDVLVGVTGYKGFVPARAPGKLVKARGCAFESRTIAMTFGQQLEVLNKGPETFIPELVGAHQAALLVAVPGGDPVKLFPTQVGQFKLVDRSHEFAKADVFVLKYPTVAVTGLDGKFSIDGIPAGEVSVTAYLPATGQQASQHVTITAGETASVDLTIPFAAAKPAPSASAGPR